jgi:hypothetical protein
VGAFAVFQFYLWYVFRSRIGVGIRGGGWIWVLALVLFGVTTLADQYIIERVWVTKLALWGVVSGALGYYALRTYKPLSA